MKLFFISGMAGLVSLEKGKNLCRAIQQQVDSLAFVCNATATSVVIRYCIVVQYVDTCSE